MTAAFTVRSARMDDLRAATELFNEHSRRFHGESEVTIEEARQYWEGPDIDVGKDIFVAEAENGSLVAYGDVGEWGGAIWLDVRGFEPEPQRALISRLEERAEEKRPGAKLMSFVTEKDETLLALYQELGYQVVRHSFRMEVDLGEVDAQPGSPDGVTIRRMRDGEEPELYEVHQETFKDTWMHTRDPFEEWEHWFLKDPSFDPSLWFVAETDGEIAGVAFCRAWESQSGLGWIRVLGVRRPFRRRGIGETLLRHVFAEFRRREFERVGLGVDAASPTGAVTLYERAGMKVARTNLQCEKVQG
jgi:mycothiol synthase